MLIRALIVLLIFLNLGVAGWWLTRAAPLPPVPAQAQGVPLLALTQASARPAAAPPAPAQMTEDAPASPAPPATEPALTQPMAAATVAPVSSAPALPRPVTTVPPAPVCLALGPYPDQAAARAAQARLQPAPRSASVRSELPAPRAYAVVMPALADRASAQAVIERIAAAGFKDLMIISSGPSTNGVALGRYSSRASAERRQAALQAGGFPAQVQPVGQDGAVQWWLDVAFNAGDAGGARAQAQAARAVPRDCG